MKGPQIAIVAALAALTLAGCTHYHTTEIRTSAAPANTVVVPPAPPPQVIQQRGPDAVVLPKSGGPDTESVTVAPDSTVTVNRPPSS